MMNSSRKSTKGGMVVPIFFIVSLIALILFGVIPNFRDTTKTRLEISELQADLKQQRTLLPIHLSLEQRKQQKLPEGVYIGGLYPLRIADVAELPNVFEALARESEVELVSAIPQVRSLQGGREMLLIDARMRGKFLSFNNVLKHLNEMVFVDSVETLSIDVTHLGHEISLSVWLAIQ